VKRGIRCERAVVAMPAKPEQPTAFASLGAAILLLASACERPAAPAADTDPTSLVVIYQNGFNGPIGQTFPEWTSSPVNYHKTVTGERGSVPAGAVAVVDSPNHRERFLGEFGGPPIGRPGDPDWNRTQVDQTVTLSLGELGPHTRVVVSFDLYVLKSWDGNSRHYGPDRFQLNVARGPVLLDTTFSNNPKVQEDGSTQNYPDSGDSATAHPRWTGAASTGTLGYSEFFKDNVYHLSFQFAHAEPSLRLEFGSSLFEGKGTADESWGLDNVTVQVDVRTTDQDRGRGHRP
jgi:hypothetical protein